MLVLKTVPLLDVKESPDKIFFSCTLNTNLPRSTHVNHSYEDRFINQSEHGGLASARNFKENDPVWVKISDHFPWKAGFIVKVCPNQSFEIQVDNKVYCCNTSSSFQKVPQGAKLK